MTDTKKIDDGGPAFARPGFFHDGCTAEKDCEPSDGMSLRDWFAGQALIALGTWMPVPKTGHPSLHSDETLKSRAEIAYRQADAMLSARKAGEA